MTRTITIILITVILTPCKSKGQLSLNVRESLRLFKSGSDLMMKGFKIDFEDSLTAQKYYRQAIDTFIASLRADTTDLRTGTYLSDLYYKVQKFDSALFWSQLMFPFDSIEYFKKSPKLAYGNYAFMGKCFIYEGDLSNGKKYFQLALRTNPHEIFNIADAISDIADKFYFKTIPAQINKLSLRSTDTCKYSIDILLLGLEICTKEKAVTELLFNQIKIKERQKTCK